MNTLSKGVSFDSHSTVGRVGRIEQFLSGFQKQTVTLDLLGIGLRQVDTLVSIGGEAGDPILQPFQITTSEVDGVPKYRVAKGSITNGTNGTPASISSLLEKDSTASAGYVVLSGDVKQDLTVDNWSLSIVPAGDGTKEVLIGGGNTPRQTSVRLVIGKITMSGQTPTVWQGVTTSFRLGYGILNGVEIVVLESAPTHPDAI